MTFRERTINDLEESGLDWNAPAPNYELLAAAHRGTAAWHIERCNVLCNTFHVKLFGLCRTPRKNQVSINKKPWLHADYASSIREGLLEQIVAEEAIRAYQGLTALTLSQTDSMRAVLDEYPAAAQEAPSELVESAEELGKQAGYMIDLWNRTLTEDPELLELVGVQNIAAQARRDAIVSFITCFRATGAILARIGMRYLTVREFRRLLEEHGPWK